MRTIPVLISLLNILQAVVTYLNPKGDFTQLTRTILIFPTSSIEQATVERLAAHFDSCVEEAVTLVLSLPDGDYKQDMLHVSIYCHFNI